jgi:hypothetical protein
MTDRELAAIEVMEHLEEEQEPEDERGGNEVEDIHISEEEQPRNQKRVKDFLLIKTLQPKKWKVEQAIKEF